MAVLGTTVPFRLHIPARRVETMGRLLAALALGSLAACASHHHSGDADGGVYSSIRVVPETLTVTIPLGMTHVEPYKVYGTDGSGEHEITDQCALAVDGNFGSFAGATLTAIAHGGQTQVTAGCGASSGTAQ